MFLDYQHFAFNIRKKDEGKKGNVYTGKLGSCSAMSSRCYSLENHDFHGRPFVFHGTRSSGG